MADEQKLVQNKRAKSKIWQHFKLKEIEGTIVDNLAVCNNCKAEVKYAGGTSNLSSHIRRHHPSLDDTVSVPKPKVDTASSKSNICDTSCANTSVITNQQTIPSIVGAKYPCHSQRAKLLTHKIACFIIKDLRPYRIVDAPEFRDLIKAMDPRYDVPGRKHFSEITIPQLYNDTKEKVLMELSSAEQVAITTDGWTSRATESYITVTSSHINQQWKMKNFVLQTRLLSESHTAENLAKVLTNAFEEWGISGDPVPPIVSDNASNIVKAGELLGCTLHFKCFAHTLNLAAQKCLKTRTVSRLLGKIRHIVAFFHRSTTANALMLSQAELLSLPNHKLKIDVCTRWNSTYDMLSRFLEMQCAVVATIRNKQMSKCRDKDLNNLTDDEIALAEDLMACLQPLKSMTKTMCDEKYPTLSMIMPLKHKLLQTDMVTQETDSAAVKEVKKIITTDIQDRYLAQEEILLLVTVLDPRFKTLPFVSDERKYRIFTKMVEQVLALSEKAPTVKVEPGTQIETVPKLPSFGDPDEPSQKKVKLECKSSQSDTTKSSLQDLLGDVYITGVSQNPVKKSSLEIIEDEVKRFREMSPIPLGGNPLKWWFEHEVFFPKVARLAKKLLCIPGTSVPSERVFSTSGDIITASRASLKPHHVDKLLFLKKNL